MQFGIDMWAGPGAFFWGGSLCICLPDYDIFCPEREHENMLESGHVVALMACILTDAVLVDLS